MPKSEMQRLKILYIADYLMKETDDELDIDERPIHGVLVGDIKNYLEEKGIKAEEHSISRDIDLLRGVYKKTEKGKVVEIKTFSPLLDVMGGKGKPIYLGLRYFPYEDLQDIAECIASAPFLSQNESAKLIEKLQKLCSKYQAERLSREYIVAGRPKYTKRRMLKDVRLVKEAIEKNHKISFLYTRSSKTDFEEKENRRRGKRYIVSPFKIALSDGHYYLIGYGDYNHKVRPYRIDRMVDLQMEKNQPREGKEEFNRLGINDYARQTFGMFIGGKANYITIRFHTDLLDAMLERFGRESRQYTRIDEEHFTIKTFIVESENFYGWVCGLGEKAVIIDPPEVAERFKDYLKKIEAQYQ